jgi:hypothetical protein
MVDATAEQLRVPEKVDVPVHLIGVKVFFPETKDELDYLRPNAPYQAVVEKYIALFTALKMSPPRNVLFIDHFFWPSGKPNEVQAGGVNVVLNPQGTILHHFHYDDFGPLISGYLSKQFDNRTFTHEDDLPILKVFMLRGSYAPKGTFSKDAQLEDRVIITSEDLYSKLYDVFRDVYHAPEKPTNIAFAAPLHLYKAPLNFFQVQALLNEEQ